MKLGGTNKNLCEGGGEVYGVVEEGYGGAVVQACGGGGTMVIRTRNSKGTDTKTSNSTCGCRHKFNDAN
jgi:hypothetical protein